MPAKWVWVIGLTLLAVLVLVVPGLAQRWIQSTGRPPEPQEDGTYVFRGTFARQATEGHPAQPKRRGRLLVERVALRWEPTRGTPEVIPFKGLTLVGFLGQRELGAKVPSEQLRLLLLDPAGRPFEVFLDACERPLKTERPSAKVRGPRYTAWLADHLLATGLVMDELDPESESDSETEP